MIDVFGVTPELQNQLDANNRAEDRENDQQHEGRGGECRGMRLIGRVVFGFCLDVGHFLLTMRRRAQHGSPAESKAWSLSALLNSCYPLSDFLLQHGGTESRSRCLARHHTRRPP